MVEPTSPAGARSPVPWRRKARRRTILAGGLAVLGFGLVVLGHWERQRISWIPVRVPLTLSPGARAQARFQGVSPYEYTVRVVFHDPGGLTRLGAPAAFSGWFDWMEQRLTVRLAFTAAGGGYAAVEQPGCLGTSNADGPGITCAVGRFRPEAGVPYTLDVEVVSAAPELRGLETHLDVSLGPAGRNNHMARAALYVFPGLLALAAAGVLGLAGLVALVRARRTVSPAGTSGTQEQVRDTMEQEEAQDGKTQAGH